MTTPSNRRTPRVGRALARLRDGTFLILAGVLELIAAVAALAFLILGKLGWLLVSAILGPPRWAAVRLGRLLGRYRPGPSLVIIAFVVVQGVIPMVVLEIAPRRPWVALALLIACLPLTVIIARAATGRAVARPQPKPKPLDDFA